MKYFILAASLFLVACGAGTPSKDEYRESISRIDNHTHIEIRTDNYTSITVTDKDHSTTSVTNNTSSSDSTNNSDSSDTSSSDTPFIRMMNSDTYDMSAAAWAIGTMPTLTFFIEGESKRYQINQNGLRPGVDNFTLSNTGFFTYTIDKNQMVLRGANVASDNTSNVTLLYKTSLYLYIQNTYQTVITELAPVEFTIRVN
tara:strand:- start:57 stop:656 length:600 start_codon:yes stop_codon:yes gene_type:complete